MCLNEGKGVPKNPIEANIYFKAAIDKGHTNAMHQYGSNLEHGNGITKNIEDAFQYYSMAADKGNFSSRTSLKRLSK
jgi:TPR repeat protein